MTGTSGQKHLAAGPKLLLELGPLGVFFVVYSFFGVLPATGVLMAAVLVTLVATRTLIGRWPVMPLVTAAMVLIFGGLTLYLHDATFIKMKATIVYCLFGIALLGGLLLGKPLLAVVMDSMLNLTEQGWRQLTLRWALFFFALAILNEVVWRTQSEAFWVKFKVFGFIPITMLFALAQTPLILRQENKSPADGSVVENADHV